MEIEGTKYPWYALHVKSRFEKVVQVNLEQKGFGVFLPTYVSMRRWSDRTKAISLPLFPGYVFCCFNIHERLPILVTPGVQFVVGLGQTPIAVDDAEIAAVRLLLKAGVPAQPWPYLREGEAVRVEEGPLQGLTGLVVRAKGASRLIVSVSLLMRSVSVEIDRHCVVPTENDGWRDRNTIRHRSLGC